MTTQEGGYPPHPIASPSHRARSARRWLRGTLCPEPGSVEPTLAGIFLFPLGRWRVVVGCAVLGMLAGFVITTVQTPRYVATLTLVPNTDDQLSAMGDLPSLGSLSSLAGGGGLLSKPERVTPFQQFRAMMTSLEVAQEMERRGHYLEKLYPDRWDAHRGVWRPRSSGLVRSAINSVKHILRLPVYPHPVPEDLARIISDKVDASEEQKTSIFNVSYANKDRALARAFVIDLYYSTEAILLRRERSTADARVLAAQQQLDRTTVETSRQALLRALAQFNIKAIQAKVGSPYAARIISGPDALDTPTDPSVVSGLIYGFLGGLLLSFFSLTGIALQSAWAKSGWSNATTVASDNPPVAGGMVQSLLQFPRLDVRESLLVLTILATYLLPVSVQGLVTAHALLLVLITACAFEGLHRPRIHASAAFVLFFFVLSLSSAAAMYFGLPERFMNEVVKLVLLFLGTYFIGTSFSAARLRNLLALAPWLCLVMVLIVFIFVGSLFAVDGRLEIEGFLSSNVLGYLLVLNMAIVWARPKWSFWDGLVFTLLTLCMMACLSRGAMIAAAAVFALHFGIGRSTVIFVCIAAILAVTFANNPIIERMLILQDALSTGGSGRTEIWGFALQHWFTNPLAWLAGFGPGSIHIHIVYNSTQDAAHSMYIGTLHYLGLLGLAYLFCALASGIVGVLRASPSPERVLARDFLAITIVNGLVDETYNASQVTAFSAICFAVVVAIVVQARAQPASPCPN